MSLKLKVLGMGLLAVLATSAFAAMNASAIVGGHFTHDAPTPHATIIGTETSLPDKTHVLHFVPKGGSEAEKIGCDKDEYHGVMPENTTQKVTITPKWSECYTTGTPNTKFDIHENGCDFEFTSGKTGQTHHTAHLRCPVGAAVDITHPNCTITVPEQTVAGVTYETLKLNEKHTITLTVTAKGIKTQYHGGICIFLGTSHEAEMTGSVTVEAKDTDGNLVNLTSTTGA